MKSCILHIIIAITAMCVTQALKNVSDAADLMVAMHKVTGMHTDTSKMKIDNMAYGRVSLGGALSAAADGETGSPEGKSNLIYKKNVVDFNGKKEVSDETVDETASVNIGGKNSTVYFRINCDFNLGKELAVSDYSTLRTPHQRNYIID